MFKNEHARQVDLQEYSKTERTGVTHEGESLLVVTVPADGVYLFTGMGLATERRASPAEEAEKLLRSWAAPPAPKSAAVAACGEQVGTINLVGEFDCSMDIYLAAMCRMGAEVALYESYSSRFYSLGPNNWLAPLDGLAGTFSPVTRRLTRDYPRGRDVLREAQQRLGAGHYEILLLRPVALAERMDAIVREALAGQPINGGGSLFVRYRASGGQLVMFVERAVVGGREMLIGRQFTL